MKDSRAGSELNLESWFVRGCYAPNPAGVLRYMIPLFAAFLWLGLRGQTTPGRVAAWIVAGTLTWTLLEYAIHRFFFHWTTSSPRIRDFLARAHLLHHRYPNDTRILSSGPFFALPVALFFLGVFSLVLGMHRASLLMAGVSIGFTFYEWVHFHAHASTPRTGWMKALKKYHLAHHYQAWNSCYGVTSPAWDRVFGTTFRERPKARDLNQRAG